jgi:hypothetical protein
MHEESTQRPIGAGHIRALTEVSYPLNTEPWRDTTFFNIG